MKRITILRSGDPTVIMADLDAQPELEHLLWPDEVHRARRFSLNKHRQRYIAGRGILRLLLGDLLMQDPAQVHIATTAYGKPVLSQSSPIDFSVSHSGRIALYAFSSVGCVGIDVEEIRTLDPVRLAQTCFSDAEQAELKTVDPELRLETFFDGWVRKEAVAKADGRGLSLALQSFTVTLGREPRVTQFPLDGGARRWQLMEVDAGPAVRAALAIQSHSEHQDGRL